MQSVVGFWPIETESVPSNSVSTTSALALARQNVAWRSSQSWRARKRAREQSVGAVRRGERKNAFFLSPLLPASVALLARSFSSSP